ncbi:hypothetical protein DSQ43_01580 [Ureaplasma urealyticum]|nr:hypothetical protein DSQ43_01580 [Ureaplasma urealyticum]RCT49450.1 hypothetical protein DTQ68_01610 [Ureaplasma parvum]
MQYITINNAKTGKILISKPNIKKFIEQKFNLIVNKKFVIKSIDITQYDESLVDISIIIALFDEQRKVDLDEVRDVQNHLASFIYSNLGVDTKSVNIGIDL